MKHDAMVPINLSPYDSQMLQQTLCCPNSPSKFQLFYSIDGTTWIEIGKYDFNPDLNAGQIYGLPPVTARYFKYVGLEGRILRCLLGEINVYGE